jgi:hypothetical protein
MRETRLNFLFGYGAAISSGSYKYGKPFKVNALAIQPKAENGLPYKSVSSSVLFNSFLFDLEYLLFNYPYALPVYDETKPYQKNAIVLYRNEPIKILENIGPNGLDGKYISLNERQNFLNATPKQPYWSTASLKAYFSGLNNELFLPSPQDLANIKYIQSNLSFMVKDYLDDPNVAAHAQDQYHIHIYDESFLMDPTDAPNAFKFNFPKRLIFTNSTNSQLLILKNIFRCFPANSQIKICAGYDDGIDNFMDRDVLEQSFPTSLYFLSQNLEITQVYGNKYIIECVELEFHHSPTYIDMEGKKITRVNQVRWNGAMYERTNTSLVIPPNIVSQSPDAFFDLVTLKDNESIEALNFLKPKPSHQIARLHLDRYTYFFVKTSQSSMGCVRLDNILSTFTIVSRNIPIDPSVWLPKEGEVNFRIVKNYGQLSVPTNHLFVCSLHNNGSYAWSACYLIQDGDNFSFSPKINSAVADAQFVCQTQIKVGDYLYLFDTTYSDGVYIEYYTGASGCPGVTFPKLHTGHTVVLTYKKFNLNSKVVELKDSKNFKVNGYGNTVPTNTPPSQSPTSFGNSSPILNYFLDKNQNTLSFSIFSSFICASFTTTIDNFSLNPKGLYIVGSLPALWGVMPLAAGLYYSLMNSPLGPSSKYLTSPISFTTSSIAQGYNIRFYLDLDNVIMDGSPYWPKYALARYGLYSRNSLSVLATRATANNQSKTEIPLPNNVLVGWYDD